MGRMAGKESVKGIKRRLTVYIIAAVVFALCFMVSYLLNTRDNVTGENNQNQTTDMEYGTNGESNEDTSDTADTAGNADTNNDQNEKTDNDNIADSTVDDDKKQMEKTKIQ